MTKPLDRTLILLVLTLVVGGFLIFSSASLGLLSRGGARFSSVAFSQLLYGIIGGSAALLLASGIHYRLWRKYALPVFLFTLALSLLVFAPGIGLELNGAHRWLSIGFVSFQPAEFLKIGYVMCLAAWLSAAPRRVASLMRGAVPFCGIAALGGGAVLLQPDTDTFVIMMLASGALFLAAGGRWRHALALGIIGALIVAALALSRPYIMNRIAAFLDPSSDPQGASYHVNQSLIALGSGGLFGRGFGQSIQKFEHLPEPISDSIFAVYGEEFGFLGSAFLVLLFSAFALRGYKIATDAPDRFGMLLVVGLVTLIIAQTFLNIASMLALVPLSGLPLPFISQGGTALLAALASVGIILNVSKYRTRERTVLQ